MRFVQIRSWTKLRLRTYVENGEEDEEGVDDERDDVGERGEGERHLCSVLECGLSEKEDLMSSVSVFAAVALLLDRLSFPYCRCCDKAAGVCKLASLPTSEL